MVQDLVLRGPVIPKSPPQVPLGKYLMHRLRLFDKKTAQIFPWNGMVITYNKILERSINVALDLKDRGVKKGDVIVTVLENCPEFTYILLGAFYIGAILAPINPSLDSGDMNLMMKILEPRIIFTIPDFESHVKRASNTSEYIVLKDGSLYPNFMSHPDVEFQTECDIKATDTAVIMSSSGTTGLPKGVQLSHGALHAYLFMLRKHNNPLVTEDVYMNVSPMFWVSGVNSILLGLDGGHKTVMLPFFTEELVLSTIEKYKVTVTTLGPSQIVALAKYHSTEKFDVSSIRFLGYGGAPLRKTMRDLAEQRLGLKMTQLYGLTESILIIVPGPMTPEKPESCGILAPNTLAKVIDLETGQTLGPSKEGELCFKTPTLTTGYYRDLKATATAIDAEGWLHTGDIGCYDEDGYFYIFDRIKELIKYKGIHISPVDLEDVLLSHPDVKEAAVIGIHHDLDQEHAMGFVVRKLNGTVTETELLNLVKEKLSQNKHLHGGVQFIDTIPRTPSGKILRRELRKHLQQM